MTVGFRTSTCNSCGRTLPRAAARCPWCRWQVGIFPVGETKAVKRRLPADADVDRIFTREAAEADSNN